MEPLHLFCCAFALASGAGYSALLKSERQLSRRAQCTAILHAGFSGLGFSLVFLHYFPDHHYLALGLVVGVGFGYVSFPELLSYASKKHGLRNEEEE